MSTASQTAIPVAAAVRHRSSSEPVDKGSVPSSTRGEGLMVAIASSPSLFLGHDVVSPSISQSPATTASGEET